MRAKLLARRASRIRPGFDDKVLADWNGLLIAALAKAADVFVRVDWLEAAERAFDFVCTQMTKHGRLLHSYRAGEAKAPATATDYANMIKAALALATVTGNPQYIARAREWVDVLDRHYWAEGHGGYFLAADDTDDLIVRTINALDDATPNANGTMVSNLMQLYLWTGEERYRDRAEAIVRAFAGAVAKTVFSHTGLLTGVHRSLGARAYRHRGARGRQCARASPRARRCVAAERGGAGDQGRGLTRECVAPGELAGARQDRDRRQAHGLCLHRPAMLRAGDGGRGAGGGGAGGAADHSFLTNLTSYWTAARRQRTHQQVQLTLSDLQHWKK